MRRKSNLAPSGRLKPRCASAGIQDRIQGGGQARDQNRAKPDAKLEAKSEAKAASKPDCGSGTEAETKPKTEAEPKPDAKLEAAPEAKTAPRLMPSPKRKWRPSPRPKLSRSQTQNPRPRLKPRPRLHRKPRSKPKPEAGPKPPAKADVAALLNTSLGDLLMAGLVKDPEDAGRIIAAAISQAKRASGPSRLRPKAREAKPRQSRARSEIRTAAGRRSQDTDRRDPAETQVNRMIRTVNGWNEGDENKHKGISRRRRRQGRSR